jgi:hypothetical protein
MHSSSEQAAVVQIMVHSSMNFLLAFFVSPALCPLQFHSKLGTYKQQLCMLADPAVHPVAPTLQHLQEPQTADMLLLLLRCCGVYSSTNSRHAAAAALLRSI